MKDKISRRDFIKLALTGMGAFLASCMPRAAQIPALTLSPASTRTGTPEPTSTNTLTATQTPSETPTPTDIPCFHLLAPENGAKLSAMGKVIFSWEAMQEAAWYQWQFTFPSGQVVTFGTVNPSNTCYIESFLAGGIYKWQVIALDDNNSAICIAEPFTFEKPAYVPTQINSGGGNDGGSNDSGSNDGGGQPTLPPTEPPPVAEG